MSSRSSAPNPGLFRLEWRPSRLHCLALVLLGGLAGLSCLLSAAPWPLRIGCALLACAEGIRLARREGARECLQLQFSADYRVLRIGPPGCARRLVRLRIHLQGTLASVSGQDEGGRTCRLSWWPDTLGSAGRRVLRLAAGTPTAETGPTLATMRG